MVLRFLVEIFLYFGLLKKLLIGWSVGYNRIVHMILKIESENLIWMILFSDVGNCVADGLQRFECETSVQPLLRADFYYTRLPKLSTALLLLMFLFLFYFLFRFLLLSINLNSLAVKWTLCPSADSKLFFRFFFIYIKYW